MDTMKILLGATAALLLGALVMSWNSNVNAVNTAPPDQIAQIRAEIKELRLEQDRIQQEKQLKLLRENTPAIPSYQPQPQPDATADLKAQLAAKERQLQEIADAKAKAERDAKVSDSENVLLSQRELEKGDKELGRARLIAEALLVGRISEYREDGGFVTFQLAEPKQVPIDANTVLAIRRGTGILGRLQVSEVTPEGAIANLLPGFGTVKPKQGDELIIPPPF